MTMVDMSGEGEIACELMNAEEVADCDIDDEAAEDLHDAQGSGELHGWLVFCFGVLLAGWELVDIVLGTRRKVDVGLMHISER